MIIVVDCGSHYVCQTRKSVRNTYTAATCIVKDMCRLCCRCFRCSYLDSFLILRVIVIACQGLSVDILILMFDVSVCCDIAIVTVAVVLSYCVAEMMQLPSAVTLHS